MRAFRLTDAALAGLAAGRPSTETLAELRRAQLSRHLILLSKIIREIKTPRWYAGQPPAEILADPMTGLYAATAVAALRSGGQPPDRATLVVPGGRILTSARGGRSLRVRLDDADPLRDRLGLQPAARLSDDAAADWQRCLDDAWRILVDRHPDDAATLAAVLRVIVPVEPDPGAGGVSATSADAYGAVAMSAPADGVSLAVGLLHETRHSLLNATRSLFDLVHPSAERGYSPWRDDPRPPSGILHGAYAYLSVTRFWRTEAARAAGVGSPDGRLAGFEFARWRAAVVAAADGLLGGDLLTAAGRRFVSALRDEAAGWLHEPVDPEVARLAEGANIDHRVRWRLRNLRVDPAVAESLATAWRAGRTRPPVPEPAVRPAPHRELAKSTRLSLIHALLRSPPPETGAPPRERAPSSGPGRVGRPRSGPDLSLRNPALQPGGGVRPGDDAYLRGDHGTAYVAYLQDLLDGTAVRGGTRSAPPAARPDLEDVWSGLALVMPALRERPELVRAVYLALDVPDPADVDLPGLVAWLAG